MSEKKPKPEKKHSQKKKEPLQEKERVKKLIEEKMEKIRKQELAKKEEKPKEAKPKPLPQTVFVTGKRKKAVARGFFRPGKGIIRVNSVPLELLQPEMLRLRIMEPLMLIGDAWKGFDAKITVKGGGPSGQAEAVRMVIARGLSEVLGEDVRKTFLSYDRNLLVYDPRRTEPHKPPHSSWGPRRYKQRSKR